VALVVGADWLVKGASSIATRLKIPSYVIGLTLVACGTSLPEFTVNIISASKGYTDIAFGNVVGSNIFNILLILGVTGAIHPVGFNTALNFDLQVFMGGTVLLIIFMFTLHTRKLDRWEALLLVLSYVTYTVYLVAND